VHTDKGEIACEIVVNCGGMFAAEIGRMAGVRIPLIPMSHQYVVTEAFLLERGDPLPTLRDPDLLVYFRQEVNGLVMGGYERDPEAWTATAGSYDAVPADFNGRLLPENWPRFEQIAQNSQIRVPDMADIGVRMIVNGPEAFTPDNEFCLGETEVEGFFVAAGFCAHGIAGAGGIGKIVAEWIVEGQPSLDVWHMDISRFGRDYRSPRRTLVRTLESYQTYYDIAYPGRQRIAGRPLRTSPAYPWHAANGAFFGEKAGWERVDYYENERLARRRRSAAGGLGRTVLVAGDRRRARRDPHHGRPVRRDVVRQDRGQRPGCRDVARMGMRQPGGSRRRRRHLYAGAEQARRD
jgi:FAD dependent oxidoreductase/FAD-dependent oxidoreductase family protein